MTGLVEALVSRFEIQDHFSDIPNGVFYIQVAEAIDVSDEQVKSACDDYNYTYRGMTKVEKPWEERRAEVLQ